MANTPPSIQLTGVDWQNLNALSGLAVGTAIEVQNQSSTAVSLAVSPTKPDINDINFVGFVVPPVPAAIANIGFGEDIVWAIGVGPVSVQKA